MSDLTIPDIHRMRRCLDEFYSFASAHDPDLAALELAAHDVSATRDAVAILRTWLARYGDALQRRR
jgi:hypothetical protein